MNKNITTVARSKDLKFVGLDVHKKTIAVAVADREGARLVGIIRNDLDDLRKVMRQVGSPSQLRVCYEAGACGYVIYRFLRRLKIDCVVVAPSLIPKKPGDRVKTDRRDALMLARLLRSGELTSIWVPDPAHEALRDLTRAREDAVEDRHRARHRLITFLLRLGITPPAGVNPWTLRYRNWLTTLSWQDLSQERVFAEYLHHLEELEASIVRFNRAIEQAAPTSAHAATIAALQAMRGIKLLSAATIVAEIGDITRFKSPRQLMAYAGMVPSEHSSGGRARRGGITKTGNAHVRRILTESAWSYRQPPRISAPLRQRQAGLNQHACSIAWQAQQRLHQRYRALTARGKIKQEVVVAVGRELLAFIWAVAQLTHPVTQSVPTAA